MRPKRNKKTNRFRRVVLFLIAVALTVGGITSALHLYGSQSASTHTRLKPAPTSAAALPESYEKKSDRRGSITTISYTTKMIDGSDRTIDKEAMVYLPYGYKDSRKYNVFYLCHGYGASNHTFLGTSLRPHAFKNILDNMIRNGDIEPLIVVTPTYTDEYGFDYYMKLDAMAGEIVNDLIPAVEGRYSTYAAEPTEKGFIRSRSHRAIGGFSMGGCATWRAFRDHLDYFRYYLPMSMPMYYYEEGYDKAQNDATSPTLAAAAAKSGYGKDDYAIYAASGDEDFMNDATRQVVETLRGYPDEFDYTEKNFADGNLMYTSFPGKHRYFYTFPYIYNGLTRFFRE